ncbi:PhnD/SsuA/transferrin family substrate-binding protein [Methylomagnum sp.]
MNLPSLTIQPAPSADATQQCFHLQGVVDVDAIPALEPLYALPTNSEVELDFAAVQRVNSMGLAQLLKLFEHWQAKNIDIRVSRANRMTGMLFKMTGLTRFLVAEAPARAALAANGGPAPQAPARTPPMATPSAPSSSAERSRSDGDRAERDRPPLHLVPESAAPKALAWRVHMQSSQQLNGWYFLNTHLQRRLSLAAHLDIADNLLGGLDRSAAPPDLVFTRPFDAVRLMTRHGYRPLARPSNQSDEVTLLARADDARPGLADFAGSRAVAASRDSFVYLLGRYLLDESGVPSDSLRYVFPGHEIKAVQTLLKGEADLLFMPSENYQRLSGMTRRMLRELDHSEAQFAFQLWCLSPRRVELAEPLRDFLLSMDSDETGRGILAELGCAAWVEPAAEDIAMLERVYGLYGAE